MYFTGTHTGEETDYQVILVVRTYMINQLSNFCQSKWVYVSSTNFKWFDVLEGGTELISLCRLVHDRPKRDQDVIDSRG